MDFYETSMLSNFILKKDFHVDYIGDILYGVDSALNTEFKDFPDLEYTVLNEDDYLSIFFDFRFFIFIFGIFIILLKNLKMYDILIQYII